MPRKRVSEAVGRLCEARLAPSVSRLVTGAYAAAYSVELSEAAPVDGPYASFDAFFTRALKPGARTIASTPVVSASDGVLQAVGRVEDGLAISVKGRRYEVADLVGDSAEAARYRGGSFAVTYLSPRDYHRVHAPVDGALSALRSLPGELFPVNRLGEEQLGGVLARNLRVAFAIDTPAHGRVTLVMVGALIVGRISVSALPGARVPVGLHELRPPQPLRRGEEVGMFHLGSSTVLFTERSLELSAPTGPVRLGAPLSRPA